jgi:hypothetical protein
MWHEIYNTAVSTCKKFRGAASSYIRKQKANVILFETGLCLRIRLTVILNLIHSAILPASGVGQIQVWMPALFASILRIPQMI